MPIDYAEARRLSAKFMNKGISIRVDPITNKLNPDSTTSQEAHKRIMWALAKQDWKDAATVGAVVQMHPTTARDHLNHIESTGRLESRVVRRGPFNHAVKEWRRKR